MTEKQILRIKKKIRSLRAKLSAEKRKFGGYDDSAGNRYIIAELYLELGAFKLARKYFDWFDREFPGDIGFPEFNFGRVRTLYEFSELEECRSQLIDLEHGNTYLIDLILDRSIENTPKWEWSNMATLRYAKNIRVYCMKLVSADFAKWLAETTSSPKYKSYKQQFIGTQIQLLDTPVGPSRSELVDYADTLVELWKVDN